MRLDTTLLSLKQTYLWYDAKVKNKRQLTDLLAIINEFFISILLLEDSYVLASDPGSHHRLRKKCYMVGGLWTCNIIANYGLFCIVK